MASSPRISLRQKTAPIITGELLQSIQILSMTATEIEHFVQNALEKNPLLERADHNDGTPVYRNFETNCRDIHLNKERQNTHTISLSSTHDNFRNKPNVDRHNDQKSIKETSYLSQGQEYAYNFAHKHITQSVYSDANVHENAHVLATKPNLHDHLYEQCLFTFARGMHFNIALDLINQLDGAGYFCGSLSETALNFNVSEDMVMHIFKRLRQFDPAGIFALSLSDCLALQLSRKKRLTCAYRSLLNHLTQLAKRDFTSLKKLTGLKQQDIVLFLHEIRQLNPKPATLFDITPSIIIIPDIMVYTQDNDHFLVELNEAILPKLIVNQNYTAKVCINPQEKNFIKTCQQEAYGLIKALDQRAKTLLKVTSAIVQSQEKFLRHGICKLKPLTLCQIAEMVDMHESTISRITAHKYIATPLGTLPLRRFFSSALSANNGQGYYSGGAICHRIQELIQKENNDNVLSDNQLVALLKKENIAVGRRTVAKYREAMNIPSSTIRRRENTARKNTTKS
ncbi:RNA polymerase factor sigma-54 [Bartonella tamiae]|uniref:RNA polymerase sigma-54 factor n=1 Tax=Bartonella tamiae Th239 TaxID=1094558 RepID=J1K0S6_9HYPH|nr:RNA polymerase factor sigma-54 [Bartonella tamiae]EJF91027.1 RNA polymerase sigma-54 factor [Bartonella tamiae Th239]EJF93308.1 RNA polymerase sigma-54 factor [Bartonella tamiae Th307]